ncbi:MAG: carbohydrate-binding domain-containing protein [Bacilli bacterium]|nr:carbohydrate-binding domain-containing protein [Bacilli bacterium]
MKKIFFIFLFLLIGITTSGCNNNNDDLWDNLGGGGVGDQTDESNVDLDKLPSNDEIENNKNNNFQVDEDGTTEINLDTLSTSTLTLSEGGTYILEGNFLGNVVVEGDAEEIIVILKNANIKPSDSQAFPAITFKKHSGTRVLHIYENSINYLADSVGDTNEADEGNAVIQAKKSSLTINGTGTLNINSYGEETTGIKIKNDLIIDGPTINIDVNDNGIKAGELIALYNANLNIKADNDAIKTDVEATNSEEGNEYTTNPFAGYIYIKNCNISIVCGDDGISANSLLKIDNTNDFTINVTTNNGAPNTITEYSSDNADGKAIRTCGITLVDEETGDETDLLSQTDDNYLLIILGGNFIINSNDDAISSKGNLFINDGIFDLSSGDDAIHAEYLTAIYNGNIKINKCYEGIEGASVEIYNGEINLTSTDDGVNAANGDLIGYNYNIFFGGGNIFIDAGGDGIDSNGTVEITGGNITIWGPTRNDNAALDADKGILVNGGTLVACGPAGMVETPSTNSKQCSIVYNVRNYISVGEQITITDKNNNVIYSTTAKKQFQSLVISLDEFKLNETYTITIGSNSEKITLSKTTNQIGNTFGPGGPGGPGGPRP